MTDKLIVTHRAACEAFQLWINSQLHPGRKVRVTCVDKIDKTHLKKTTRKQFEIEFEHVPVPKYDSIR